MSTSCKMLRLLSFLVAISACLVGGSFAATSVVMKPIRETGEDVGLIFVPGAGYAGEAYRNTSRAIQEASKLRVWVALTGNYTARTPNPAELPSAVEGAIRGLRAAGMDGDRYVGIAHSLGGVFLSTYAMKSSLKAVVLLGAYVTRGTKLADYPKPVLTLSGELDGQTRITRVAVDYEQLLQDTKTSSDALYRTPVINIRGSSHAQFASGPLPSAVKRYDIKPDISDQEAHGMIGKHVSNFVTANFAKDHSAVTAAKQNLRDAFFDSGKRFTPLLNVKALDSDGSVSPWSEISQRYIAGEFASKVRVKNQILANPGFLESKAALQRSGDFVLINTTTLVDYPYNPFDVSVIMESPKEVDVKMKSIDAIRQALNVSESISKESDGLSCKALNQLALETALKNCSQQSRHRYSIRGRPIHFLDDIVYTTGIQWSVTALQMNEDDQGLHVQGVALVVPIDSPLFPGMHYCKVLSPYRAMEWVTVDSLRKHKP